MSTHEVKVVKLGKVNKHSNADKLGLTEVLGYQCGVKLVDFKEGDLAAFIEPDYWVPVKEPEFSFLKGNQHGLFLIRAMKFRGEMSYGLLIPARPNWKEGDNVIDELGIVRYSPPEDLKMQTDCAGAPDVRYVKYDMENYQKYKNALVPGTIVQISEKINGCNMRMVFHDGVLHVSSHTNWKKENDKNLWWFVAKRYDLVTELQRYPDHVFYGEVYGNVGGWKYGKTQSELAIFDIMYQGKWLNVGDVQEILTKVEIPSVPVLYVGPWDIEKESFCTGPSTIGTENFREGIVVKPIVECFNQDIGRVILKIINPDYLLKKH